MGKVGETTARRCGAAGLVAAASLLAAGAGGARPAANICAGLGLTPRAVKHADHIIREVADQRGRPRCVVVTTKGIVYITLWPPSAARDLQTSWTFDLHVTREKPPGLGRNAICIYTAGHRVEALGFVRAHRYVWMDTASRFAHTELLALAATIYAKL